MKYKRTVKTFEEHQEKLNISNVMFSFNDNENYDDNFSNFLFDLVGELGGGLPTDYFNSTEIDMIERNFRKVYDSYIELSKLMSKKTN